ncbi:hypothetical protein C8J56DRAFT_931112 [Mycena floridula]|nr:hypothetical protein C8J56DRAFT_931112 [Mycena floridula]
MGKKNNRPPAAAEEHLLLPSHATSSTTPIVDTHTHLASTYQTYRQKYPGAKYQDVYEFVREMYAGLNVEAIVDVWCEAPVEKIWKEFADSALTQEDRDTKWGGLEYYFVMGVHPHNAKEYTDAVEADILAAMKHPRCVGWGEMGLDYHYDNSPREIQRQVFTRQLRHAVRLAKPLTIHTREADEDTERILKEEVPKDYKIHIHCFTDSPDFGKRLLDHFPNLHIGVTGVVTFSTNLNTIGLLRDMRSSSLRIVLETDAPYMIPGNIYSAIGPIKGRFPLSHSAMIPYTTDFVSDKLGDGWTSERVLKIGRENARNVYGV